MAKNYLVKSTRKTAVARCVIKSGTGKIHVNKTPVDVYYQGYKQDIVKEPSYIAPEEFNKFDFFINVKGGGVSAQAQAARSCVAKGILVANGNKEKLKEKFVAYDRHILVDDVRQKEPKKQLGKGARGKKQHSKR